MTRTWTLPEDPERDDDSGAVQALLDVLDLRRSGSARMQFDGASDSDSELGAADMEVFVGDSQKMPHGRVFGGQVLAQSIVAAGRTVTDSYADGRPIHSLHAYFLRPGDDTRPIRFVVERMRDGRSFSARRVMAIQHGAPILALTASFQEPAGGLDHADDMPEVSGPQTLPSLAQEFAGIDHPRVHHLLHERPIEQRHVEGHLWLTPGEEHVAEQSVWMRTTTQLPDDDLLHAAVLAFSSDYALLEPVLRRHGLQWRDRRLRVASLDHAMWFHRRVRADDWLLYTQRSPSAQSGRGLAIGRMFAADGTHAATVAQEGMVRVKDHDRS